MVPPKFPTSTEPTLPGYELTGTVGIVCGMWRSDEGLKGLDPYLDVAGNRHKALKELIENAKKMGAGGVVGVVFEEQERVTAAQKTVYIMLATGTAVSLKKIGGRV